MRIWTTDAWNSLIDVCDKYQVHLASVIADRALKPEVAKTLSDIADQLMEKKEPREVLEIMLGGSAGKFFQSLHVPDWTLLYFKLQSRIPDQGWQMLLSISKLGRTGVSFDFEVELFWLCIHICQFWLHVKAHPLCMWGQGAFLIFITSQGT